MPEQAPLQGWPAKPQVLPWQWLQAQGSINTLQMVNTHPSGDEASAGQEVKKDGITMHKTCSSLINTVVFVIYVTAVTAHHAPFIGQHNFTLEEAMFLVPRSAAGTKQVAAQGSKTFSDFDWLQDGKDKYFTVSLRQ